MIKYANYVETELSASVAADAMSIQVKSTAGFPDVSQAEDYFYLVLVNSLLEKEIVKVTAVSSDTLTVVRAQDKTTAKAFSESDKAELWVTAASFDDLRAEKADVNHVHPDSTPVGTIITWPTDTAPTGYLMCDGQELNRSSHSALFAVLGTVYGAGDGSTTFNLPDYRGEFLRGWNGASGNDPDAASRAGGDTVGSKQVDEFKSHDHSMTLGGGTHSSRTSLVTTTNDPGSGSSRTPIHHEGGSETRPRNVSVMYCIKH